MILPMSDISETYHRVVDRLVETAGVRISQSQISDETEIYRDLGFYGNELYDLIVWIIQKFGVDTNINIDEVAPREGSGLALLAAWRRRRSSERYKSFKVRDIMAAIEAGRWQPPVAADENLPPPQRSFLKSLLRISASDPGAASPAGRCPLDRSSRLDILD